VKSNKNPTLINLRLNRFLASAGLGSRRGCEELIRSGQVTINGEVCLNLATVVGADDSVKVGGRRVRPEQLFYVLLHKPAGYLCARDEARKTVFDLLPRNWPRISHVGRLDKESEGLLLLTNDGELSLHLTHPRYKVGKEYEVLLNRPFDFSLRQKLLEGFLIEGGFAKAEQVHKISQTRLKIVLRQGLKRQVRLMFYNLDYEVVRLVRTRIGTLDLGDLRPGQWRFLTAAEVKALQPSSRQDFSEKAIP
jgi:23S rRNA pseudouridine2605 synthase